MKVLEFFCDDSGAVTVDFVAVTSGVLILGLAVVLAIFSFGVESTVGQVNGVMTSISTDVEIPAAPDFGG